MKTATIVSSIFLSLVVLSGADAQVAFKADLDQAQAGGTGSTATGSAILAYDPSFTNLNMFITFNGITTAQITGFHIREASAGVVGPIIYGLVNPNHDLFGFANLGNGYVSQWDIADVANGAAYDPGSLQVILSLATEGYYFNAETAAFPGGEIRGQIVPVLFGDINLDQTVNLLDLAPFISLLATGGYQIEADFDLNGVINLTDVTGFLLAIINGG